MPTWLAPAKKTRSPGRRCRGPTWRPRQRSAKLECGSATPKCPYTKRTNPEQSEAGPRRCAAPPVADAEEVPRVGDDATSELPARLGRGQGVHVPPVPRHALHVVRVGLGRRSA